MNELGYGEDIYKLAMLSHRQREDLVERLFALPGHKSKLSEFFKVIDQVRYRLHFNMNSSIRRTSF